MKAIDPLALLSKDCISSLTIESLVGKETESLNDSVHENEYQTFYFVIAVMNS